MLELLKSLLNFLLIRIDPFFFLKFVNSIFFGNFFCFLHFSLNLHYFFPFFSQQQLQVKKIWNQNEILVAEGNPTIENQNFTKLIFFLLLKKKKNVKYIITSLYI
jgi:hypothetical protein